MQQTPNTQTDKQIVRDFYELAFNQRNPAEAARKYIGRTYRQHNPLVGDGPQAFVEGITAWLGTMPTLKVEIKRMVAEGDSIAMHSHFIPAPGQRGMSVMDFFRLEDGKIVEHWDVLQEVPEKAANQNTMF